ncbi:hypothetical protein E5226_14540, partial [Cellulomonas shaoxiangyii]
MIRPPTPPRPAPGRTAALAAGLLLGGVGAATVAVLLAAHALPALMGPPLHRVDATVAAGVLLVGSAAAAWIAASAVLAGACAVVRAGGHVWSRGETAVRRWAPAAVRRALAVAVV